MLPTVEAPRAEEERGLPKQPKKPIVSNPATPGIQTPNKPDGRDAPSQGETRGEGKYEGWPQRPDRPQRVLRRYLRRRVVERKLNNADYPMVAVVEAAPVERPRERRASTRRTSRGSPSGDPDPEPPRPPLTAAERFWLRGEVSRLRLEQIERDRVARRELFAEPVAEQLSMEFSA